MHKETKGQTNFISQRELVVHLTTNVIISCWFQINIETWIFLTWNIAADLQQCFTQTMATLIICYQLLIAIISCVWATLQLWDSAQPRKLDSFTKANQEYWSLQATHKVTHFDNLSKIINVSWKHNKSTIINITW